MLPFAFKQSTPLRRCFRVDASSVCKALTEDVFTDGEKTNHRSLPIRLVNPRGVREQAPFLRASETGVRLCQCSARQHRDQKLCASDAILKLLVVVQGRGGDVVLG